MRASIASLRSCGGSTQGNCLFRPGTPHTTEKARKGEEVLGLCTRWNHPKSPACSTYRRRNHCFVGGRKWSMGLMQEHCLCPSCITQGVSSAASTPTSGSVGFQLLFSSFYFWFFPPPSQSAPVLAGFNAHLAVMFLVLSICLARSTSLMTPECYCSPYTPSTAGTSPTTADHHQSSPCPSQRTAPRRSPSAGSAAQTGRRSTGW